MERFNRRIPNYRRGWTGRDYHVTGGHEAEALAAERAKKPNRFGVWLLRRLGYKGPIRDPPAPNRSS
jgi:hypothetical protein